jgi:type IV pilus assembly protein PilM
MGYLQSFLSSQGLLPQRSHPALGLDISSSSVKLLELRQHGDGFSVESYAAEPLPEDAVVEKRIIHPEKVADAIQRAVKRARTSTRDAVIAVSGSSVITKVINMPSAMPEDEMEEQIKLQADQYIPYPTEEVNLDFQVLGSANGGQDMADVLLAACRTDTVEERISAIELAELTPRVVDIEAHALENASTLLTPQMPQGGKKQTIAIVDMGATTTTLQILHDLQTVYTREQFFGGRALIDELARCYNMSAEEAQRAQRQNALPQGYETDVLEGFVSDMVQQIDNSLQFFFSSKAEYDTIDQIMLAGGCANIPQIDRTVAERVGIPAVVAEPLAKMRIATKARTGLSKNDAATLLIACGLAMRAFD